GFQRRDEPLGYVWPSPISVKLPVGDYAGAVVAHAGADQCLTAGETTTTLDGSSSRSATQRPLSYEWRRYEDGCLLATSPTFTAQVTDGLQAFVLHVTDDAGHTSDDDVLVQVGGAN